MRQKFLRVHQETNNKYQAEFKKLAQKRRDAFAGSSFPIKQLTFEDDQLFFGGLPFNEQHVPKSTLIAVGVKIGQMMNPNLRVLIIRDGSLLGKELLKRLIEMCEKKDYQLLIEVVDRDDEKELEIQFIESKV